VTNTKRDFIKSVGIFGAAGITGCVGNSGEQQCDPSLIENGAVTSEATATKDPEIDSYGNYDSEITKVDVTLTNRAEFPVEAEFTISFFGGGFNPDAPPRTYRNDDNSKTINRDLEPLEIKEFQIEPPVTVTAREYETSISARCP
jgi:hypothetical protein